MELMTAAVPTIGLLVVFFISYYWDLNKRLSSEIDLHQKISSLEGMDSDLVAFSEKKMRKEILLYYALIANRKMLSLRGPIIATPVAVVLCLVCIVEAGFCAVLALLAPSNALGIAAKVLEVLICLILIASAIFIGVVHWKDRRYVKQIEEIRTLWNVDKADIDTLNNIYRRLKEKEIPDAEMSDLPTTKEMNSSGTSTEKDTASID